MVKRALAALFFLVLFLPAAAAADQARLESIIQDVPSANGHRYGAKDNLGNSLDTLKIILLGRGQGAAHAGRTESTARGRALPVPLRAREE